MFNFLLKELLLFTYIYLRNFGIIYCLTEVIVFFINKEPPISLYFTTPIFWTIMQYIIFERPFKIRKIGLVFSIMGFAGLINLLLNIFLT